MLELGCGDGGNLVPMASRCPARRSSASTPRRARSPAGAGSSPRSGWTTSTLEARTIEAYEPAPAASTTSSPTASTRGSAGDRATRCCASAARACAANGVAYVSYNTFPGGRVRQAIRDMLLFHTAGARRPARALEQARALLASCCDGVAGEHGSRVRCAEAEACSRAATRTCSTTTSRRQRPRLLPRVRRARRRATGSSTSPRRTSSRCRPARLRAEREALLAIDDRCAASSTSTSSRAGCSARRCSATRSRRSTARRAPR